MKKTIHLKRREFIKSGLFSFAGVIMLPSCLKNYTPFQFFTSEEALLVLSVCEALIPEDENGPGATQAGVIYYIDKQLSGVFSNQQSAYRNGLVALQKSCRNLFGSDFEDLSDELRIQFLKMMENNNLPGDYWMHHPPADFFSTIVKHSMQGFYGPPRHGGNKNYISYKIMNLDYPYVVGQNRYREKTVYE